MRYAFGDTIAEIVNRDKKVHVLVADIGYGVFDKLREENPSHFRNLGIMEQGMIGVAAGMAMEGLQPWCYTITPYLLERPFEQIKLDIDQQNVNVKLVGYADYPTLGLTHSEIDGKWLMGKFENIISYFPKTSNEVKDFLIKSYLDQKPAFISLKKDRTIEWK